MEKLVRRNYISILIMRQIRIQAKCGDRVSTDIIEDDDYKGNLEGEVPDFFPEPNFGEYVSLQIDVDTGRILNWIPPTKEQWDSLKNNP